MISTSLSATIALAALVVSLMSFAVNKFGDRRKLFLELHQRLTEAAYRYRNGEGQDDTSRGY